ncbi:MAG: ABC transporter substrate-binding protein [Candidatus Cloacimonetes bacterium]|nr:ABC transporter substrate-binding protein [Candidatus Cloacimonadota bacterium]
MAVQKFPESYENTVTSDYYTYMVYTNIHGTLLTFGHNGFINHFVDKLVTEEENRINIKLRKDLHFSDGHRLTAHDVAASYWWTVQHPASDFYDVSFIDSIYVKDDFEMDIYSHFKVNEMLGFMLRVGILREDFIQKGVEYLNANPVTAGDFYIHAKSDSLIVFKKNKYSVNLHQMNDVPDTVELLLEPNIHNLYSLLCADKIDYVQNTPLDNYGDVISDDRFLKYYEHQNGVMLFFLNGNNVSLPSIQLKAPHKLKNPLSDQKVRQAIASVIDMETFIEEVVYGKAYPIVLPAVSSAFGYPENRDSYKYDPEHGKRLMAEAGFADGFELEIRAMDGNYSGPTTHYIASSLKDINIDAKIDMVEYREFDKNIETVAATVRVLATPDPKTITSIFSRPDLYNFFDNYSPKLESQLKKLQGVYYEDITAEEYNEITEAFYEEAFIIPIMNPLTLHLINKKFVYVGKKQMSFTNFHVAAKAKKSNQTDED